jgi:hypothetical protein
MAQGYHFAPGISACRPAGRLILLDLARDRYFALTDDHDAALSRLITSAGDEADRPRLQMLADQGLLVPAPAGDRPRLCPQVQAAQETLALPAGRTSPLQTARATLAVMRARQVLRHQSLDRAIADLRARRPAAPRGSAARLYRIVAAFRATSGVISPLDQCLPRSLALARRLFAAGLAPDLVIGVAVQPFRAHCWLQLSDQLLVDDIDTVRQFTPILVL